MPTKLVAYILAMQILLAFGMILDANGAAVAPMVRN
jgi:hypothetical protein